MRMIRTGIVLFGLLLALHAQASRPVVLQCGSLLSAQFLKADVQVPFVNLEAALKNGRLLPGTPLPAGWMVKRAAGKGRIFAMLVVSVDEDRVLGSQDYVLVCGGEVCPCLGLSGTAGGPYDLRHLAMKGPAQAEMIFSLPSAAAEVFLRCAYEGAAIPEIRLEMENGK